MRPALSCVNLREVMLSQVAMMDDCPVGPGRVVLPPFLSFSSVECRSDLHAGNRGLPQRMPENRNLELELIRSLMAQMPMLRGEVGACVARAVSVERGGMGERGCARRLG